MTQLFPQTILQLYAELLDRKYDEAQLIAIRRAYEFQCRIFTGLLSGSGKSQWEHGIGTAGILVLVGAPLHLIQAAFVHNVYGLGDFGDGHLRVVTPRRREVVRQAIGERAERCVERFREIAWNVDGVARMLEQFDDIDELTRETLVLRLADHLEHHLDAGLLYRPSEMLVQRAAPLRLLLPELARRLGYPQFVDYLERSYQETDSREVPDCLHHGTPMLTLPPLSYSLSLKVRCIRYSTTLTRRARRPLDKLVARLRG
jgi:(p)ppGpp synthase/HD superfamily hydrolase